MMCDRLLEVFVLQCTMPNVSLFVAIIAGSSGKTALPWFMICLGTLMAGCPLVHGRVYTAACGRFAPLLCGLIVFL